MKLLKSIKWRLQLWYGLILVVVLAGFGGMAYQLERNRQFRRFDDELHKRIGALAQQLHRPPRGPLGRLGQGGLPDDGPPPDQFPEDGPPNRVRRPPSFTVTPQIAALFDESQPNQFYFCINGREDKLVARSDNFEWAFTVTTHLPTSSVNVGPVIGAPKPDFQGPRREFTERLPSGETVRVGGSLAPELKELRRTAINLTAVGGLILLVGLAGGWWLVSRSLKPISTISAAAAKISAGDLSQRINVAEAESELGQLAAVLNSTFARLEAAFAQQKQFASDAAHELRTPVSVILTQTQTALNRERDAAGYKQTVEACQRAAQRMRRLIESLLELARFDAGQEMLKRLPFDFVRTISESVELVQPLADERGVKIVCELEPLEIAGDSGRLTQVVTNLLTNAIQYNKPGGEVRVALGTDNGLAVLKISDTGQGIGPEDLSRVFERFYRADQSRTGAGNSGLGLAICKAIVEAHGGTIEVASDAGNGSVFIVRLPA